MKKDKWIKLGVAGVDSGQLLITDPCYINSEWKKNEDFEKLEQKGEFSYAGCCNKTLSKEKGGQLNFKMGHAGAGVVFSSGLGDGTYEVWGKVMDIKDWGERIVEVKIICW